MRSVIFLILAIFCLTGCQTPGPLDGPVDDHMVLPIFFGAWVTTSDDRFFDTEFYSYDPKFRYVVREEGKKNKTIATGTYHVIYNDHQTQTSYLLTKDNLYMPKGEYRYEIWAMRYRPKQDDQNVVMLLKNADHCGRYYDANADSFNNFNRNVWIKKIRRGENCHFDARDIWLVEEHFSRN